MLRSRENFCCRGLKKIRSRSWENNFCYVEIMRKQEIKNNNAWPPLLKLPASSNVCTILCPILFSYVP